MNADGDGLAVDFLAVEVHNVSVVLLMDKFVFIRYVLAGRKVSREFFLRKRRCVVTQYITATKNGPFRKNSPRNSFDVYDVFEAVNGCDLALSALV